MPSTFTGNTGIELIADGEQSSLWGQTTNDNLVIVDRALNGSVNISLSGTTHTLTTADGVLSDGQFAVLVFTGSPSGTNTVTIAPNTAQKTYFVTNSTAQTVVLSQGSGATVSVPVGRSRIVFTNGAGAGAAVFDITNTLSGTMSQQNATAVNIDGGTIDGTTIGAASAAPATFTNVTANGTINLAGATVSNGGSVTTVDINGGTIDGTVIGGSTPAAISGTTGSFSGNLTVDTNTLFVDAANNRVGIGTSSPSAPLDIDTGVTGNIAKLSGLNGFMEINSARTTGGSFSAVIGSYDGNPTTGSWKIGSNGYTDGSFSIFTGGVTSERLRIDASGNVGIGFTSPSGKLGVNGFFELVGSNGTTPPSANPAIARISSGGEMGFFTGSAERARIDASGRLLVNQTSGDAYAGAGFIQATNLPGTRTAISATAAGTAAQSVIEFANPNGKVGDITTSGTTTSYNTSSDYRLKEDVQPMVGASDRVLSLKPCNFAWKADGTRVDGFLAHEAQAVVPEAVTGEKDAVDKDGSPVYQGIDQSKLVPLLTAALQNALKRIEALEAQLT